MYEVVGVEDAEDRKKLYFLIQRLQTVSARAFLVIRGLEENATGPFSFRNNYIYFHTHTNARTHTHTHTHTRTHTHTHTR